jgi:hypothetical protein
MRYESWTLRVGMLISVVAYGVLIALAVISGVQHRRKVADGKDYTTTSDNP